MVLNRLLQKLDDELQTGLSEYVDSTGARLKRVNLWPAAIAGACWATPGRFASVPKVAVFEITNACVTSPNDLPGPNKAIPSLELMGANLHDKAAERTRRTRHTRSRRRKTPYQEKQSFHEVLDERASEQMKAELIRLSNELEKARDAKDAAKVKKLEVDYDLIEDCLKKSTGLGNRPRQLGPPSNDQRARETIRKALERVCEKLESANPPMPKLAEHLRQNIMPDGSAYVYRPSPHVEWLLE